MEVIKDFRNKALDKLQDLHQGACIREQKTLGRDFVDLFAWQYGHTILYVIAETQNEFSKHLDKIARRPDNYAGEEKYFVIPAGVITPDQVPNGFGVIYVSDHNGDIELSKVRRSSPQPYNIFKEKDLFVTAFTNDLE